MANPKHLKILEQGVEEWNQWRKDNPEIKPDLIGAKLSGGDLIGAKLSKVGDLSRADLRGAKVSLIIFGDNDLSVVEGLDTVEHRGPSTIGIDTLYSSGGKIPEVFLRGCGVDEHLIRLIPSLLGAVEPFQLYSQQLRVGRRLILKETLEVWVAPDWIIVCMGRGRHAGLPPYRFAPRSKAGLSSLHRETTLTASTASTPKLASNLPRNRTKRYGVGAAEYPTTAI